MKTLTTIARILLGLVFLVFGLNGFLNFIPPPKSGMSEGAMAFGMAMMKTGYLIQLVSGTEVVTGALLLLNRLVPLVLVVLAPVIVNIIAFHLFLDRSGLVIAGGVLLLELYLAWVYRRSFVPLLTARVTPA